MILSIAIDQKPPEIRAGGWSGRNYVPNAVPTEFGTSLNWRSGEIPHKLKASIGSGGRVTIVGGLRKDVASATDSLANARVPKYATSSLFLPVIA